MSKTKPKQSKEKVQAAANIPGEAPTSSSAPFSSSLPANNVPSEKTKSGSSLEKRTPIAQSKKKHSKGKAQATAHIPEEAPTSSSAPSSSSLSANNVPSEKTKAGGSLGKRDPEPIAEPSAKRPMTVKELEKDKRSVKEWRKKLEYIPLIYLS